MPEDLFGCPSRTGSKRGFDLIGLCEVTTARAAVSKCSRKTILVVDLAPQAFGEFVVGVAR
jgi:hypothetical protein